MRITVQPSRLQDVLLVRTDVLRDERGFFMESWNRQAFLEAGIEADFMQDNHSRSRRNVLRGLHYQDATSPMGKLVRCTIGSVFDVAVDLRLGSPTFGGWVGYELSEDNMDQLWVPPGFGHGFAVLSESADVQYKCSGIYTPSAEGTLAWDDPDVGVAWPVAEPILSAKDRRGMSLEQYRRQPAFTHGGSAAS